MEPVVVAELQVRIAILETQLIAVKDATLLQAKEYERRLHELNNEHARQVARNESYVSKAVWDVTLSEWEKWRRDVDRWRWISMGVGVASGGAGALLAKLLMQL